MKPDPQHVMPYMHSLQNSVEMLKNSLPCCLNCIWFKTPEEVCTFNNQHIRPPVEVITFGCGVFQSEIPF